MFLQYGSYRHPSAEVTVLIDRKPKFNEGGEQYAYVESWQITGFLQAANAPAITLAIASLQQAYSLQGRNLGFFNDDGTPTAHGVISANTLGGVRIVDGPSFPRGEGAEYSTFRYYTIRAEWMVPDNRILLVSFREKLAFTGTGGPQTAFLPVLDLAPPRQILRQVTTVQCVQSGRAVGWRNPYPPMPPLFPQASEHVERRRIAFDSPERHGVPALPQYSHYTTEWSYEFEDLALFGVPNRWLS